MVVARRLGVGYCGIPECAGGIPEVPDLLRTGIPENSGTGIGKTHASAAEFRKFLPVPDLFSRNRKQ